MNGPTLATGDMFVSDMDSQNRLASQAQLVDMEGYAVAAAAVRAGTPVRMVKFVSDSADENAKKIWQETVDECAKALGVWCTNIYSSFQVNL
ncbi:hypothetical protein ACIBAC_19215 [Streptomyces sp. NPDC051362]|uniref:phosphorylase family protein n=1 Tax=Streptomyces sp. NPDC051362 TaxID=3365651 RepID=UPI0037B24C25